jgi:UDP-2,3-diacylglucosamine pyrophosphatase LpxH
MFVPPLDDDKETVCVLAGDIGIASKPITYINFIRKVSKQFRDVIYILGNHEMYHGKFPTCLSKIKETCVDLKNVHVLEKESFVIDNVVFICATLWTDFDGDNPITKMIASMEMNDFRLIRTGPKSEPWKRKFTPDDAHADFNKSKLFIFDEIVKRKEEGRKVVVVVHHAPSHQSTADCFKGDKLAGAYASNLEDDIIRTNPDILIHGHMHASADYMIGNTRIVLNPRGYVGHEENDDFDPLLVIEV